MKIDMSYVMGQVNKYASSPSGKKQISNALGGSGSGNVDLELRRLEMIMAGREMVALLRQHAASAGLPASVMSHVESFFANAPKLNDDGSGVIYVSMSSDPKRPSMYPEKYDGVSDIVALFNYGYEASNFVYGKPDVEIEGQSSIDGFFYTKSKKSREGLGFLEKAVEDFNATCGGKYNVRAILHG